jgi:hypothetical protein
VPKKQYGFEIRNGKGEASNRDFAIKTPAPKASRVSGIEPT